MNSSIVAGWLVAIVVGGISFSVSAFLLFVVDMGRFTSWCWGFSFGLAVGCTIGMGVAYAGEVRRRGKNG